MKPICRGPGDIRWPEIKNIPHRTLICSYRRWKNVAADLARCFSDSVEPGERRIRLALDRATVEAALRAYWALLDDDEPVDDQDEEDEA